MTMRVVIHWHRLYRNHKIIGSYNSLGWKGPLKLKCHAISILEVFKNLTGRGTEKPDITWKLALV